MSVESSFSKENNSLTREYKQILSYCFYNSKINYKETKHILQLTNLEHAKEKLREMEKQKLLQNIPNLGDMRISAYSLTMTGETEVFRMGDFE
ncbi:MAG: hypothetical protein KJI71_01315 [Patescibacteria group bacterium]|nr:hypothetical protein [Patescibacteria group bacterium]